MNGAVLFDLDETLFDRTTSVGAFVQTQFLNANLDQYIEVAGLTSRFLELDARGRTHKLWVYQTILQELGIDDHEMAKTMFRDYENTAWHFARPFDGVDALLKTIADLKMRTAIVTNGQTHIQLRSLLALNLDRRVDAYLISEQEGCRKPEAEIFVRAADRLGVQTKDCIFVGDSPEADMLGAHGVGMKTIWFSNGALWPSSFSWQPDATITSLSQANAIIRAWATNNLNAS
jgi:putative hydrolase of the HAD superfamily